MSVSICIPTFNQAAYLPGAVRSALAQSFPAHQVIVGDDDSTDETQKLMVDLFSGNPKVIYRKNEKNLGIAGNNTQLMRSVSTDYIARLDSDDLLEPDYLKVLIPLLNANPRAAYAHAAVHLMDHNDRILRQVYLFRTAGYQPPDEALRAAVRGYRVAANVVVYRRAALEEMNFFEGRPSYVEDSDIAARFAAAGWGNVYADQILARYRVWTDAKGTRLKRKELELSGYCRIFDEVLEPAFQSRGWSIAPLRKERRRRAMAHSNYCFLSHNSTEEQQKLVAVLRQLGPSRWLELKMVFLRLGLAPGFEYLHRLNGLCKVSIKKNIRKLQAIRGNRLKPAR